MRWAAAGLLVAAFLATGAAQARPHMEGRGAPGGGLERAVEQADLEEGKRSEILEILDASRAQHRALRGRTREAHEQMAALLAVEAPDEAQVMAQAETLGALQLEASKARLRTLLAVRGLLTADEWADLSEHLGPRPPRR
ncbi:MAG: Spy/CpxP family protein refolding chaperone [Myxococcota bacterium]